MISNTPLLVTKNKPAQNEKVIYVETFQTKSAIKQADRMRSVLDKYLHELMNSKNTDKFNFK